MSRTGDCWDNAVAESFFGTLKAELVDNEQYASREIALASIANYIDSFYNVQRRGIRFSTMSVRSSSN